MNTQKDVKETEIKPYERLEWTCYCFGSKDEEGLIWVPSEGKVPNWFWRTMQYLILGNRWVKEKGNKNEN